MALLRRLTTKGEIQMGLSAPGGPFEDSQNAWSESLRDYWVSVIPSTPQTGYLSLYQDVNDLPAHATVNSVQIHNQDYQYQIPGSKRHSFCD